MRKNFGDRRHAEVIEKQMLAQILPLARARILAQRKAGIEQFAHETYADNLSGWITDVLGSHLWARQRDIISAVERSRYTAVSSCNAAGKSYTVARLGLAYLYTHPDSVVITTAPNARQVRRILWREVATAVRKAKRGLEGELLTTELRLAPDWFMFGFTAPERAPDKFQGYHQEHILVIVDEASGVSDEIFEAIDSVATGVSSRVLLIGNPLFPSGRYFRSFGDTSVESIYISAFDTPNFTRFGITLDDIRSGDWTDKFIESESIPGLISPQWVSQQLQVYGESSPFFVARVLGQFPYESDDALLPYGAILKAQELDPLPVKPDDEQAVEVAVDVARYGSDESVIASRVGVNVQINRIIPSSDIMTVAGAALNVANSIKATRIKVDVIGVGAGVVDRLREVENEKPSAQRCEIVEMNASAKANDSKRFANARAEWHWSLRELLLAKSNDLIPRLPSDEKLSGDLAALKYDYNSSGQLRIESKSLLRSRLGRSPDRGDVIVMLFAPTRAPRSLNIGRA